MKAHQDDHIGYESLTRSAQLNCQMDYHAKKSIWESDLNPEAPILGRNKLTSDKGDALRFWVQKQLARSRFHTANILYGLQFNSIDWEMVHKALNRVSQMFQIWLCKQVMNIAPWEPDLCPLCPKLRSSSGDLGAYPPLQPLRSSRDIDALD